MEKPKGVSDEATAGEASDDAEQQPPPADPPSEPTQAPEPEPEPPFQVSVGENDGRVTMGFNRSVSWVRFSPGQALSIANKLRLEAEALLFR